jgi:hypothetical protein
MPTFSDFMKATNFLQVLQGAIERAGQEFQRRKLIEQGLNQLALQIKTQNLEGVPEYYRQGIEAIKQATPALLAGTTTPTEAAGVLSQVYGALAQTKKDIFQYFEASKAIDELRRNLEATGKQFTEIAGKVPEEYKPFFQAYAQQYKNIYGTALNLAQTLLKTGQTEQALQIATQAQPIGQDFVNKLLDIIQAQKTFALEERRVKAEERRVETAYEIDKQRVWLEQRKLELDKFFGEWSMKLEEAKQKLEQQKFEWGKVATLLDFYSKELDRELRKFEAKLYANVGIKQAQATVEAARIRAQAMLQDSLNDLMGRILGSQGQITAEHQAAYIAGLIDRDSIKVQSGDKKWVEGYYDPEAFARGLLEGRISIDEVVGDTIIGSVRDEKGNVISKFTAKHRVPEEQMKKAKSSLYSKLAKPGATAQQDTTVKSAKKYLIWDIQ